MTACFAIALFLGWWLRIADPLDGQAYDWLFTNSKPANTTGKAIILAIDEASLMEMGGARNLRDRLAKALDQICAAKPLAVAVDLMLSTEEDKKIDEALAASFRKCPNVVLGADIVRDGSHWEEPIPGLRKVAAAIGHVHADPDPVSRRIPLEKAVAEKRYWALALEAFRVTRQAGPVLETPDDLTIGMNVIPASRNNNNARRLYVRYETTPIPQVTLAQISKKNDAALAASGKVVFIGFTDQSAARDRLMTPMGQLMTGVEIHANLFETLDRGVYLKDSGPALPFLLTLAAVVGAGLIFAFLSGWIAWVSAASLVLVMHLLPWILFRTDIVLPPTMILIGSWLSTMAAASFHYFVIRRQWQRSEADKTRYQQAIHFVTHEMKTPLTAIQGSSEIMSRYKLNEEKQKQIAQMIHSESKRLAGMIQTFLNVERLAEGEIELKRERFSLPQVLLAALERVQVLVERKEMELTVGAITPVELMGDKELLEYAFYNLLNNAVKYSESRTAIECRCSYENGRVRVAIEDHGMGMEPADLKKIFDRFYRSKRAEESGISGTGIGLSIVHEIVKQHDGKIEVSSKVGSGSTFTVILPVVASSSLDSKLEHASRRTTPAG